jgi:aryl-alcohol dehydrogenase-like predicted oxidoreductase
MRRRLLGATPIQVTELALGTWGLSGDGYGPVEEVEQDRVIDRALAIGVRAFETADCYAEGRMEQRLGERLPKDRSVVIVTKLGTRRDVSPPRKDFAAAYLREAFEKSRERLKRERIDCVLLHNPSAKAFEQPELAQLFEELLQKKAIGTWGASVGSVEAGEAAIAAGAQVVELAYNVLHTAELRELGPRILEKKAGILVRSVLSHGLLAGLWSPNKEFALDDHRRERWNLDELRTRIQQLNAMRPLVSKTLPSMRCIALRFALANEQVSSVVLGPRNTLQLDQLVREAGREPPYFEDWQLSELKDRFMSLGVEL